jgi:hypothetical protein
MAAHSSGGGMVMVARSGGHWRRSTGRGGIGYLGEARGGGGGAGRWLEAALDGEALDGCGSDLALR